MLTLTFYVFFEIVALFFMYSAQRKRKKYKIKNTKRDNVLIVKKYYGYLFLSAFPIIFLLGFRDISVGYDTKEYVYTFFRIANGSIIASDYAWLSYGYIFICKIIGFFSKNGYLLYNLIIAVLTIYFFIKHYGEIVKILYLVYSFYSVLVLYIRRLINQDKCLQLL